MLLTRKDVFDIVLSMTKVQNITANQPKYFKLSMQEIVLEYEVCKVYTVHDISDMITANDLSQKNKIHLMLF